ncbi:MULTISPECIES: MFS transporter [Sphingomonadales]|uniref:Major facilitator superfamily (MFS) profile domain-containing protein n=1 Tax=Sphingobium ummariense RL-3 TaxID=1346791 RepID=T0JAS6_9SPHN|nr:MULTISPECIES: MFS transporter [Sphingomonadaceae]EQB33937.1 hypothetical protein M529_02685 [Sphingobium ummariense RL-3]WOF45896.1 MFS transporter [Sphingopyxis indica]
MSSIADSPASVAPPAPPTAKPNPRVIGALVGILLAAMISGLNNRVGALALADVRGLLGVDSDEGSWIDTAYAAGELVIMPFAAWFAITLSVRRFQLWFLGTSAALAAILPFVHNLNLLVGLRFVQGVAAGGLIPILMMAALKFLPPAIRLHGLALYALTATFAPNLSIWLAGQWTDALSDWRWIYWQFIPAALLAGFLMERGLPREPIQSERFQQGNWRGMAFGIPALVLIAVALTQGVRLDWFNSPLITQSLIVGIGLLAIYLITEWFHPTPFVRLHLLGRRNLGFGFLLFTSILIVLLSGVLLPALYLGAIQDYRPLQTAPVGLIVALPQLVLGFFVAAILYQKWVDARVVFVLGLFTIALACLEASQLTSDWNWRQFVLPQALQAIGQPLVVVSTLFLITSVVRPDEGPSVSGMINTLRVFGTLIGSALIQQLVTVRGRFHTEMLLDHAAFIGNSLPQQPDPSSLMGIIGSQGLVLATADAYRVLGVLAVLLIPIVFLLNYIPAPDLKRAADQSSSSQG